MVYMSKIHKSVERMLKNLIHSLPLSLPIIEWKEKGVRGHHSRTDVNSNPYVSHRCNILSKLPKPPINVSHLSYKWK